MTWAKVDVDMPTDWKLLEQPLATRHLWTCLICLSKKQDESGAIRSYDCARIAGSFNIPRKAVAEGLTYLQSVKSIELDPDGTIRVLRYADHQGDVRLADQRAAWRDRKRKQRVDVPRDIVPDVPRDSTGDVTPQKREEKKREDQEQDQKALSNSKASSPAAEVFKHWQLVMGKPRSVLDKKRESLINARLSENRTVTDLCLAIDGYARDPFSMGKNDRNTKYNDISLICRDATHVEKFMPQAPVPGIEPAKPKRTHEERMAIIEGQFGKSA